MSSSLLREHDAQQGAQSKGEFLGMSGNSSWWLLGSAGLAVLMVTVLWGIFGFPLPLCLVGGFALCGVSVLYVLFLKNDKPAHYDTDFFESVLIEAGAVELSFGPREQRPENPFRRDAAAKDRPAEGAALRFGGVASARAAAPSAPAPRIAREPLAIEPDGRQQRRKAEETAVVPLPAFERLQEELQDAQENLETMLGEPEDDGYAV